MKTLRVNRWKTTKPNAATKFLAVAAFGLCLVVVSAQAAIETDAVLLPANGRVLLMMGQDTSTLRVYKSEVLNNPSHSDMPAPGGVTLYTSMIPTSAYRNSAPADAGMYVSGIEGPPTDESNGEVNFRETLDAYDEANGGNKVALAVGLYLSDEWIGPGNDGYCGNQPLRAIIGASGLADMGYKAAGNDVGKPDNPTSLSYQWRYAIDRMIAWFKAEDRPVYLRIGYEFDGDWNCYHPPFYIEAFRQIKRQIDAQGATNIATVWHSATYPNDNEQYVHYAPSKDPIQHLISWYPGDDYVDWMALSFFYGANYLQHQWSCQNSSRPWTTPEISPRELQNAMISFAREHHKPVMIAESAPQGYQVDELTGSCISERTDHLAHIQLANGQELWDVYYRDYFQWIEDNRDQLRAVAYINADWQSQSRWYCAPASRCARGYWGDTTIQKNRDVLDNFKVEARKPFYINGVDDNRAHTTSVIDVNASPKKFALPTTLLLADSDLLQNLRKVDARRAPMPRAHN